MLYLVERPPHRDLLRLIQGCLRLPISCQGVESSAWISKEIAKGWSAFCQQRGIIRLRIQLFGVKKRLNYTTRTTSVRVLYWALAVIVYRIGPHWDLSNQASKAPLGVITEPSWWGQSPVMPRSDYEALQSPRLIGRSRDL